MAAPETAEFYRGSPENLLRVQRTKTGGVLICARANHLTPEQQEAFIGYLRAEGFMAAAAQTGDRSRKPQLHQDRGRVRWIVDDSWPGVDPAYALHIRRLCLCTFGAAVVWLTLMTILICC